MFALKNENVEKVCCTPQADTSCSTVVCSIDFNNEIYNTGSEVMAIN